MRGKARPDLNLLPVLQAVLDTQSLRHAASKLGMSPSAVSDALVRLRLRFGDSLVVQRRRIIEPTAFGARLKAPLAAIMAGMASLAIVRNDGTPTRMRGINLNLMWSLRALLRRGSVTVAAKELSVSQPAVSGELKRLRALLGDPILIARGQLTPRAMAMAPLLEDVLHRVENLLDEGVFDPAQIRGEFVIATADYVMLMLGPGLVARIGAVAPGLTLCFREASGESVQDLRAGRIDIMIYASGATSVPTKGFELQQLFEDEMVAIMRDRADAGNDDTTKGFVAFSAAGKVGATFGAEVLNDSGSRPLLATMPSYLLLPFLVEGSGAGAIVPRRLASRLSGSTGTRVVPPPFPLPPLRLVAAWNAASTHDPLHAWVRSLLNAEVGRWATETPSDA